jgi:hypothetical protein
MKQSLTNQKFVHCHVCPLKDLCEFGDAEMSYKHHNNPEWNYLFEMGMITVNCPLRKVLDK